MYLEFHRGVYTSNHTLKQGNRRTEAALGELEWLALEAERRGSAYPHEEIEALWQRTELLQFHDILPGSSTSWVNRDARQEYARLARDIEDLAQRAWSALAGARDGDDGTDDRITIVNPSPHPRREVIELSARPGGGLRLVSLPGRSAAPLECACAGPDHPVRLTRAPEGLILDNGLVRVLIGDDGNLHRVRDLVDGRDLLLPGQCANRLVMHPDHPSCFDAWELQEHYRHDHLPLDAAESIDIAVDSPLRARVRVLRSFGSSRAEQTITLDGFAGRRSNGRIGNHLFGRIGFREERASSLLRILISNISDDQYQTSVGKRSIEAVVHQHFFANTRFVFRQNKLYLRTYGNAFAFFIETDSRQKRISGIIVFPPLVVYQQTG